MEQTVGQLTADFEREREILFEENHRLDDELSRARRNCAELVAQIEQLVESSTLTF
jgi:hypothetical protein